MSRYATKDTGFTCIMCYGYKIGYVRPDLLRKLFWHFVVTQLRNIGVTGLFLTNYQMPGK
jgi:hypothetical protein